MKVAAQRSETDAFLARIRERHLHALRAQFAAAALSGLIQTHDGDKRPVQRIIAEAFDWGELMACEHLRRCEGQRGPSA